MMDLRSVGDSDGNKMDLGIKEWQEIEEAYDYLKAQPENKGKKIGFYGISMGGSTAIITAGHTGKGDFVVAAVPFSSHDSQFVFELEKEGLPVPLALPLLQLTAMVEFGIDVPIMIITARKDRDVSPNEGKILFDLANKPKNLWEADTEHDVFDEKPDEFKEKVLLFLESVIKK